MTGDDEFLSIENAEYIPDVMDPVSGNVAVRGHFKLGPGTSTFVLKPGGVYDSGAVWVSSFQERVWNLDTTDSEDKGGPQCTQAEVNITPDEIVMDITQLEGLCHGYKIELTGGGEADSFECGFSPERVAGTTGRSIRSDKKVESKVWSKNGGCEVSKMSKSCCHRFIAKNSYRNNGFCQALQDSGCNAYCWAYDEKRCEDPDTCTFDAECNPTKDNPNHPLHTFTRHDDSVITVTISDLSDHVYDYMTSKMPQGYGQHTNAALCGNPGTCNGAPSAPSDPKGVVQSIKSNKAIWIAVLIAVLVGAALMFSQLKRR
jgi:hypothetical protein